MPEPPQPLPVAEPRLTTDGLVLRAWDLGDLSALVAAGVDPTVRRFRYSIPNSDTQAQAWLTKLRTDREAGRRLELAIAAATDLTAVGSVSLQDFDHGNATVRYWLAPTARGRGLATCAVRLLAGWAFHELALARLWLQIEPENVASQRVAERCGFVREGRLRSHFEGRDGGRMDVLIYGLLPGELHEAPSRPWPQRSPHADRLMPEPAGSGRSDAHTTKRTDTRRPCLTAEAWRTPGLGGIEGALLAAGGGHRMAVRANLGAMMDSDPRTDAELLQATRGEVEAFGVFYRRHVEWVLGFLARRVGDPELAADLTSEVFAAALLSSRRYEPGLGEPKSWLFGIVLHKLASASRRGAAERRARRRLAMSSVPVEAADLDWIDALARAEDGQAAMGLLSRLPADQRDVVTARGCSRSASTTRSRLRMLCQRPRCVSG
jgi:RimJ/RimL family protein N-acetyltransferase/DNA-directed RNA polymerase specialized sigma24 family protein